MENNNPQNLPAYIPDTKIEKKSHLDKLAEVFLPEDLESIGTNIYNQVIIPAIMQTAGDIIHKSIDMIFGTKYTGPSSTPSKTAQEGWTTYSKPGLPPAQGTTQILPVRTGVYDYSVVRFKSVEEAQRILNNMRVVIQNTGSCTVGKYMDFLGYKTLPEDYNFGWTNLTNVKLQKTGDPEYPYRMILPNPTALQSQSGDIYI